MFADEKAVRSLREDCERHLWFGTPSQSPEGDSLMHESKYGVRNRGSIEAVHGRNGILEPSPGNSVVVVGRMVEAIRDPSELSYRCDLVVESILHQHVQLNVATDAGIPEPHDGAVLPVVYEGDRLEALGLADGSNSHLLGVAGSTDEGTLEVDENCRDGNLSRAHGEAKMVEMDVYNRDDSG